MLRVKNHRGTFDTIATVKCTLKPKIKREYFDQGERMYETSEGKVFKADTYDFNFKTEYKAIKPKRFKGKNPNGRLI